MAAIWRTRSPASRAPWVGPKYLVDVLDKVAETAGAVGFKALAGRMVTEAISARPSAMPLEQRIQWDGGAKRLGDESDRFSDAEAFLTHCRESSAQRARAEDGVAAVVLSTIHQAKGLEWEAVFIAGCEDELLPHKSAMDHEEERRLVYVAVTRAKAFLTLTWATSRNGTRRKESPFLNELTAGADETQLDRRGHKAEHDDSRLDPKNDSAQLPRAKRRKPAVRVRHLSFGDGTIKSIRDDKYVIQFDLAGKKTILSTYLEILG
jgi:DNA helicase-2/ATP-dependent DNA helicase PcrA